jgi:hypothetical protein
MSKIREAQLEDQAVSTRVLADRAVTADKLALEAIDSEHFKADSIPASAIPDDRVIARMIADGVIQQSHLASGLIDYIAAEVGLSHEVPGLPYELLATTDTIKSRTTGDENHYYGAVSKFYDSSFSLAGWAAGQPVTVTPGSQHQVYFAKDLVVASSGYARVSDNAHALYFQFNAEFRGTIWVNGTEVYSNLKSDDDNTQYARVDGMYVVNVPGGHSGLIVDDVTTNRIAVLWKLDSSDTAFSFEMSMGVVYNEDFVIDKRSLVNQFTSDEIAQGTTSRILTTDEYTDLTEILGVIGSGELLSVADYHAAWAANGNAIPYLTLAEIQALNYVEDSDLTAANISYVTSSTNFEIPLGNPSTIKAALDYLSSNNSGASAISMSLDNIPYTTASGDPEHVQGIMDLIGNASTYRFTNGNFVGVTNLQDALLYLYNADNIFYDDDESIPGSPITVGEALNELAYADAIKVQTAIAGRTIVEDVLQYLAITSKSASDIDYTSVVDSNTYSVQVVLGAIEGLVYQSGLPYSGPVNLTDINRVLTNLGQANYPSPLTIPSALEQLYQLFEYTFDVIGEITGGELGDTANIREFIGKENSGVEATTYVENKNVDDGDSLLTGINNLDAVSLRKVDYIPLPEASGEALQGTLGDFVISGEPTSYMYFNDGDRWVRWAVELDW